MSAIACKHLRPRKFAPLGLETSSIPLLKGIVFDVDGTLCLPQNYMFRQMREALGIDSSVDILHHIRELPVEEQPTAVSKVQAVERRAMADQQPQPGLVLLMDYLESRGVRRALCTRNFEAPVQNLIDNHLNGHVFLPIITRDTPNLLPKPDPAGILHIASEWGLADGRNLIMVGDSIDDMTAGHMAGAATVLLLNEHNVHLKEHPHTDLCIKQLSDLIDVLEAGFVGTRENDEHGA
ncbi:HAD-superfamily hydrolase subfamily IA variant 3 [Penicillium psychrosexuale]|uniref:HAD-superfamily hydrolase subfamily IA variant 3 n=1 Tax=Penicillium psychrosexuale TaxID=1002107 RepID=UPI0025451DBA|nr:HAD-superfamily hydrolase subfamily IA variant 3 [Penicillium psychrosexuale]KAJ5781707.1 HAD-superfamily hydrolase subfamily IA variant 3 [Penicillium psychrosexuale]